MNFERILVVADAVPRAGRWGFDRRLLQLLVDLRTTAPEAEIQLAVTEDRCADHAAVANLGISVVSPGDNAVSWLSRERFGFAVVFLTGHASATKLREPLRATQPQARIAVLMTDFIRGLADDDARSAHPDERAGAVFVREFRAKKLAHLLEGVDDALTLPVDTVSSELLPAGVRRRDYPLRFEAQGPRPGHLERSGLISWGRFGDEPGNPDEEAVVLLSTAVNPALGALVHSLAVDARLECAPTGLADHEADPGRFRSRLLATRALVIARPFGSSDVVQSLVHEAVETGTPALTLEATAAPPTGAIRCADAFDLARRAAGLAVDDGAWQRARLEVDRTFEAPDPLPDAVREVLIAAGVRTVAAPPLTLPSQAARAGRASGRYTVQGQVQTAGFSERRPTALSYARAAIPPEHLWPMDAYGPWFEAHPLAEDAVHRLRLEGARLAEQPLISIVMPVYNTDSDVLRDSIESVIAQIYPHWELCAVDDASTSAETVEALGELARLDDRIRAVRSERNQGIVGASNAGLALASGEFVALLDHDDLLTPDALFEVVHLLNEEPDLDFIYSDEDKIDLDGKRTAPFFKPSWSPLLHLAVNYVTHFAVYRRTLIQSIGGFRHGFDGSQDYDLSLRATEVARRVGHLAKPVYTWRMVPGSAAVRHDAKPYALTAARRAVGEALQRRGTPGVIESGIVPGTWRPRYRINGDPLVSILIPTRNGRRLLERCITTILDLTSYRNFEFVIIDNDSDDPDTLAYLRSLKATVVRYPYRFNYARQMNLAVDAAAGEQVLFLNNDMEVISPGWLEAMVEMAQHDDVGAVGARLLFPSGQPQHEGVFVGFGGGSAGNVDFGGYFGLGQMPRDATAVTAACMLMRLEPFRAVGGFDERLRVAFNDVDLCLRLRQHGYRVLYTPYAELYHAESASRGKLHPEEDEAFFVRRWGQLGAFRDPFYNPNLDPVRPFRLRR